MLSLPLVSNTTVNRKKYMLAAKSTRCKLVMIGVKNYAPAVCLTTAPSHKAPPAMQGSPKPMELYARTRT